MGYPFKPFLLTNISKFNQFHIIIGKIFDNWQKITFEKLKTQEKTQNSSKKLRVREALASFLCPSDVKKACSKHLV